MITCHFFLRSTVRIFFFHLRYLRGKRGNERDSAPCDKKKNQKKQHQNISIEPKTRRAKGRRGKQPIGGDGERERKTEREGEEGEEEEEKRRKSGGGVGGLLGKILTRFRIHDYRNYNL